MEIRHIRYFLALAEELHFGKAAQKLFISQPPLSRQIKEMEVELGVQLFLRENKRVTLTVAGEHFKKESTTILAQLELLKQQTNQIYHSFAGEIKISYTSSIDKKLLGSLIMRIDENFPFLNAKLFELSSDRQIQMLTDQKMDIGVIRAPASSPILHTEKLYDDGFSLMYPKNFNLPDDLSMLSEEAFITFDIDYAQFYHGQVLAFCAHLGFAPTLRHQCNNMASIIEFVHLGLGISVVPQSLQAQCNNLNINFLNLGESSPRTDIMLAYNKKSKHPALKELCHLIHQTFKE
ncbi:LysR family transcriptional regulator [Sphingobacterium shayense]|uniref:LysR family transcriptional regulator n=1 Tax=Sphingobacterium shayense TaxID=626343 RepID=UPI001555B56D|nr:LysR family transcriptional regulator [Sphingobacterium shayense]NQD71529.1 LysR family transcriptional regulator [Sphingobacterium shayense]